MASGRSYDAHSYPHDDNGGGYEDHNESYLTYFSGKCSKNHILCQGANNYPMGNGIDKEYITLYAPW